MAEEEDSLEASVATEARDAAAAAAAAGLKQAETWGGVKVKGCWRVGGGTSRGVCVGLQLDNQEDAISQALKGKMEQSKDGGAASKRLFQLH